MFYYLYEIKNLINNKIYVGVHKTKSLSDGYMGSGKVINRAIKKHGIENFTKVILEQFDNSTAMYAKEKEVVTDEFLARDDVYNLRRGGFGGFDYLNNSGKRKSGGTIEGSILGGTTSYNLKVGIHDRSSDANSKSKHTLKTKGSGVYNPDVRKRGALAAQETTAKAKRKATFKEIDHQQGEKNSQFGKMWITNEQESKKIKKTNPIPEGWRKGRTMRH